MRAKSWNIKRLRGNPEPFVSGYMLECVIDITVSPYNVIAGRISSDVVVVNGTEVFVGFVHFIKSFHHFFERSEKQGLLTSLFDVIVSHPKSLPFFLLLQSGHAVRSSTYSGVLCI